MPDHDGLAYYNFSIEHRPYDQPGLGPSIEPGRFLADRYAEVAHDGVNKIRQTLEVLASPAAMPAVIHCGRAPAEVMQLFLVDLSSTAAHWAG